MLCIGAIFGTPLRVAALWEPVVPVSISSVVSLVTPSEGASVSSPPQPILLLLLTNVDIVPTDLWAIISAALGAVEAAVGSL